MSGFKSKLLYKEVDIFPYEDYLTPLCLSVLTCKTGKIIVPISLIVVRIKALST